MDLPHSSSHIGNFRRPVNRWVMQINILPRISSAVLVLLVGGCATEPPPKNTTSFGTAIVIAFSNEGLSSFSQIPMGTYHVPNSQVLISGFERGNALVIALGAVGGIAMASAASAVATDSSAGRAAVQSEEGALQLSLESLAQQILPTLLTDNGLSQKFTQAPTPTATVLKVGGDVILQFFDNRDVRPFVVLSANLISARGISLWTTRYVASVGGPRPLAGDDSWTSDAGSILKSTVLSELQRALRVMLLDVSSPYARDKDNKVAVEGYFPFMRKHLQVVGLRLADYTDWFAFSPNMPSTSLLSGVNIMDKSVASYRPATSGDSRIKALEAH